MRGIVAAILLTLIGATGVPAQQSPQEQDAILRNSPDLGLTPE